MHIQYSSRTEKIIVLRKFTIILIFFQFFEYYFCISYLAEATAAAVVTE